MISYPAHKRLCLALNCCQHKKALHAGYHFHVIVNQRDIDSCYFKTIFIFLQHTNVLVFVSYRRFMLVFVRNSSQSRTITAEVSIDTEKSISDIYWSTHCSSYNCFEKQSSSSIRTNNTRARWDTSFYLRCNYRHRNKTHKHTYEYTEQLGGFHSKIRITSSNK